MPSSDKALPFLARQPRPPAINFFQDRVRPVQTSLVFPPHEPSPDLSPELHDAKRRFYQQLAADPEGAVAEYQRRFGNVIDRDNVRELFPEYAQNRESRQALSAATYRPAGILADEMFRQSIAEPDPTGNNLVLFNAGGPGVGKSTAISGSRVDAQIIMDGTLSDYARSRQQIQAALDYGKQVLIRHVQRPFEEALQNIINHAISPDNGRVVAAPSTAQGRILARENVLRLADEHKDNPNVELLSVDNSGNRGRAMSIDELRQQQPEDLDELRTRAQDYVNAYFHDNASFNPLFTEVLRRRVLGSYAEGEGGPDSGAGN